MRRIAQYNCSLIGPHVSTSRTFFQGIFGGGKDKKDGGDGSNNGSGGGFKMPSMGTPDLLAFWMQVQNQPVSASQVSMMRQGLSIRKSIPKFAARFGGATAEDDHVVKLLDRMVDLLDKKSKREANPVEMEKLTEDLRKFQASKGSSGNAQEQTPASTPPPRVPSGQQQQTQQQPTSFANPNSPTIDELRRINLGPEIEALFAELRTMREKRNAIRSKLAEKETELERALSETKHAKDTEASLRQRLQLAEQNVLLLNSELMDLKDKAIELKASKATIAKLQQTVHSLQSTDAAPLGKRVDLLEGQLVEKEDQLRASNRKLDRLRRRDPLLQFSAQVNVLNRAEGSLAPSADAHASFAALLDECFAKIQEDYTQEVGTAWTACASRSNSAARYVVLATQAFFRRHLDHASLDAFVTLTGNVKAATSIFESAGYTVTDLNGKFLVAAPKDGESPISGCGPFALAAALNVLTTYSRQSAYDFTVGAAHPAVSEMLATNKHRSRLEFDTSRSSKPGGQAANVSETQITVRLFVDNVFCFSSEAQDTRSAVTNKDLALERLSSERLHQFNAELARTNVVVKMAERASAVLSEDDAMSSLLVLLSYVEEAAANRNEGEVPGGKKNVSAAELALVRAAATMKTVSK